MRRECKPGAATAEVESTGANGVDAVASRVDYFFCEPGDEPSVDPYSSWDPSRISSRSALAASVPRVCTRACRRMLLWTLKLRPQPSNGHVNAVHARQNPG